MIDLYLACVKLGVIFVPINILYRDREIAHILHDAEPAPLSPRTVDAVPLDAASSPPKPPHAGHRPRSRSMATRPPASSTPPAPPARPRARSSRTTTSPPTRSTLLTCWQITRGRPLPARAAAVPRPRARQRPALLADSAAAACACCERFEQQKAAASSSISARRSSSACRRSTCACSIFPRDAAREIGALHAPVRLRLRAAARAGARRLPRAASATPSWSATA